jgi:type IV secretion system protein VirB6
MDACSSVSQGSGFVSSITGYVDCQAQVLGSGAWTALSMPGSTLEIVLTGFLTIFIALIGYNLLLGAHLTVRSGTLAFVKIGAVFALATSWPAYRTAVYDLVTDGPGQLVKEIGPQAGVVGSDGTLPQRLDVTDRALVQLAILGPGNAPMMQNSDIPPPPFGGFDAFALGGGRIVFLMTAVGALSIVRVIVGLMLALGPFFIAFLMFDSTRSLFEGWIRMLGGAALAGVGVSISLGLELALLDPWVSAAVARRMAGEALPSVPTELFVIVCLFAMLNAAVLLGCARLMSSFRLAPILWPAFDGASDKGRPAAETPALWRSSDNNQNEQERSRAAAIASLLRSSGMREARDVPVISGDGGSSRRTVEVRSAATDQSQRSAPLGRSFSRRPGARVSALAARRDS